MGKYENQLGSVKTQLPQLGNILIAIPAQITIDKLAAGLTLALSLEKLGKKVSVVTAGTPLVSHSNLYGIGNVKNSLSDASKGGDLTITLGGVVAQDGTVPSLEKLDWFPNGQDLNLVFHVVPGQRFEPNKVTPSYAGGKFDAIFVVGASTFGDLGSIYNPQTFSSLVINIDNASTNAQFGGVNVVDTSAGSLSEIVMQVVQDLGMSLDQDTASNILAGIYEATSNLTVNVKPDTFMVVSQAMQFGGKVPAVTAQPVSPTPQPQTMSFSQPKPQVQQPQPVAQPAPASQAAPQAGTDFFKFITPVAENFTIPETVNSQPAQNQVQASSEQPVTSINPQSSQARQEVPAGEFTVSSSIEAPQQPSPDWLTPKVYKGGNLG